MIKSLINKLTGKSKEADAPEKEDLVATRASEHRRKLEEKRAGLAKVTLSLGSEIKRSLDEAADRLIPDKGPSTEELRREREIDQVHSDSMRQEIERRRRESEEANRRAFESMNKPKISLHVGIQRANKKEEAALLIAQNEIAAADEVMRSYLTISEGKQDRQVWYMLLDSLRSFGQEAIYDRVAQEYATHFQASPPAWPVFRKADNRNANKAFSARNALLMEGSPENLSAYKVKDMLAAIKESKRARFDFSRMKWEGGQKKEEEEGMERLLDLMTKVRKLRPQIMLMGEEKLVQDVIFAVRKGKEVHKLHWNFAIECLQWRGQEKEFDEVALAFAERFEESPLGYEAWAILAEPPKEEANAISMEGWSTWPSTVDEAAVQRMIQMWGQHVPWKKEEGDDDIEVRWNASGIQRMSYEAAVELAAFLRENAQHVKIVMEQPAEYLLVLWQIVGLDGLIVVERRKRS